MHEPLDDAHYVMCKQMQRIERLLILGCSARKRAEQTLLPAIERYDGPPFRLLRRYLSHSDNELRVYVLSAEYGLVAGEQAISYYDQRMTRERAAELRPQVAATLKRVLAEEVHRAESERHVFVSFGRTYYDAVGDACDSTPNRVIVTRATGSPGIRLTQLHSWLYGVTSREQGFTPRHDVHSAIKLRGVEVATDAKLVMETARRSLEQNGDVRTGGDSWYVKVAEKRVGPKWLVSLMTGLPVGTFHTDEARRVLHRLGIEVHLDPCPTRSQNLTRKS